LPPEPSGWAGGFLLLARVDTFLAIVISLVLAKVTGGGQHGLSSSRLSRVFEISGRRTAMGTSISSGVGESLTFHFLSGFS